MEGGDPASRCFRLTHPNLAVCVKHLDGLRRAMKKSGLTVFYIHRSDSQYH